jgi:formylglycine-generating enzyme required for sulfatase activity
MGAVYLAEDSKLGREVALKIPFFNASDSPDLIERFIREARSAASLQHPNICTVFDADQIEGKPFITMAYIAGTPLDQQIDPDSPMPQRRAAEIARKIAIALQHAHEKGTVHRDLKPANVLIATGGEPVVMDFGLAKQTAEVSPNEAKLTRFGGILGTPSYMSPEQVRGDTQAIGPATDIYSLGVILFEMLTGRTPYSGGVGMVMGQILGAPVPPIQEFRRDVDPLLDFICQKAMAKDPKARFGSMLEFAQALGDYLTTPIPRLPIPVSVVNATRVASPRPRPIAAPAPVVVPSTPSWPVVVPSPSPEWEDARGPSRARPKRRKPVKPRQTWVYPAILVGSIGVVLVTAAFIIKGRLTDSLRTEVKPTNDGMLDAPQGGKPVATVPSKTESASKVDLVPSGRPVKGPVEREPDPAPKPDPSDTKIPNESLPKKPDPLPSGNSVVGKRPDERTEEFEYVIDDLKQTGSRQVLVLAIGGGETMEFVRIPKGAFLMGAPGGEPEAKASEKPQRRVEISRDFYMGKFEVTQAQYKVVTGSEPSRFKGSGRLPVESMSWTEAEAFCSKMSKQVKRTIDLPTEAEWEYTCRAGTTTPFHFGSKLNGDLANCNGNFPYGTTDKGKNVPKTVKVGQYPPNPWGLYDMHGNVWEWCKDYYGSYNSVIATIDPFQSSKQSVDGRVVRGGSWSLSARVCRAANRNSSSPDSRLNFGGFRVCFRLD